MKIRLGFVSNSSSSSYIIAVRQQSECCATCGRGDPDILEIIANYEGIGDDTSMDTHGLSEVVERFRGHIKECGYDPDLPWKDNEVKCRDCGATQTTLVERTNGKWQVECDGCNGRGPAAKTEKNAQDAWARVHNVSAVTDAEEQGLLEALHEIKTEGAKLADQGYAIAKVSIGYHDRALQELFSAGRKSGSIVMLYDYGY